MNIRWELVLLAVIVSNTITYFSIREILWSIVWLDKGGKLRNILSLKKEVKKKEKILRRIDMGYLLGYLSTHREDYTCWLKIKRIFACIEGLLELIYFAVGVFTNQGKAFICFSFFLLLQALLALIFLRIQFGVGGHHTKYDRRRKNKNIGDG